MIISCPNKNYQEAVALRDMPIAQLSPENASPYYIAALPYTRFSAGVKALHLLCHSLNRRGQNAYMLPIGNEGLFEQDEFCDADLLTPILTPQLAKRHLEEGPAPITVYPEIISGNPFGGASVVRYVLNYPGILGGNKIYDENELCFSYSKVLAAHTDYPDNILFIPASDTHIFYPSSTDNKRKGTCFYASKYQKAHKGKLFDVTKDSLEITSGSPNSQTPQEIAEIFRSSELFYTYENTALAIEATLCGCPAVFLPNAHLQSIIASEEFGTEGFAWGNSPQEVARAKESVKNAFNNYTRNIKKFYENLDIFITKTQNHAKNKDYLPQHLHLLLPHLERLSNLEWKNTHYAPLLRKLPWQVERQIGALLCTAGLRKDGEFLWNRAMRRSYKSQ